MLLVSSATWRPCWCMFLILGQILASILRRAALRQKLRRELVRIVCRERTSIPSVVVDRMLICHRICLSWFAFSFQGLAFVLQAQSVEDLLRELPEYQRAFREGTHSQFLIHLHKGEGFERDAFCR